MLPKEWLLLSAHFFYFYLFQNTWFWKICKQILRQRMKSYYLADMNNCNFLFGNKRPGIYLCYNRIIITYKIYLWFKKKEKENIFVIIVIEFTLQCVLETEIYYYVTCFSLENTYAVPIPITSQIKVKS